MKVAKIIFFLMLSLGVLGAGKTITVPEVKFEKKIINGNKNYKITKPVFTNKVKFKEINDIINKRIDKNNIEAEITEECEYSEECSKYELSIEPVIQYADKDVISFTLGTYVYSGGAHGLYGIESFLVNRKTGKVITDSLKNNNKEVFGRIRNFIDKNESGFFFSLSDNGSEIEDGAVFIQTGKDKLTILYSLYSVAPYAAGMPEFEYNTKTKKLEFTTYIDSDKEVKTEIK